MADPAVLGVPRLGRRVSSRRWSPDGGTPVGGMMGGMLGDPNEMFNRFSGGKDVLRRSDLTDPMMQMMFVSTWPRATGNTSEITRQQFTGMPQQFMAMRQGRGAPGGSPPEAATPDEVGLERCFPRTRPQRRRPAELRRDVRHPPVRLARSGTPTRDGFIDLNEYKAYMQCPFAAVPAGRAANQDARRGGSDGAPCRRRRRTRTRSRPSTGIGKLPKDIPQWFKDLDADGDGQVGLYEAKTNAWLFESFNRDRSQRRRLYHHRRGDALRGPAEGESCSHRGDCGRQGRRHPPQQRHAAHQWFPGPHGRQRATQQFPRPSRRRHPRRLVRLHAAPLAGARAATDERRHTASAAIVSLPATPSTVRPCAF